MGNQISKSNITGGSVIQDGKINHKKMMDDEIDYIATKYILTMDFKSLVKLHNKSYCNKLIVLTSDIINKHFNDLQVNNIVERVENGKLNGEDYEDPIEQNENIVFINKSDMNEIIKEESDKKTLLCNQIAKFYIKVANVFAAIVMTINPEYIHTNSSGKVKRYSLQEKDKIPKSGKVEIQYTSLCGQRVDILANELFKNMDSLDKDVVINTKPAKLCSLNSLTDSLSDQYGIPELIELYFDYDYDFETGEFKGMTPETRRQFRSDLNKFYTAYTGNLVLPENIEKFSDIPLTDYSKKKYCAMNEIDDKDQTISCRDDLFQEYANNLKQMISMIDEKNEYLISILNKLFVYVSTTHEEINEKVIKVNPELNEDSLQNIVVECRNYIRDLYSNCEEHFVKGLKIYEAIVEKKIFETTTKQIETMEKISEKLYTYT